MPLDVTQRTAVEGSKDLRRDCVLFNVNTTREAFLQVLQGFPSGTRGQTATIHLGRLDWYEPKDTYGNPSSFRNDVTVEVFLEEHTSASLLLSHDGLFLANTLDVHFSARLRPLTGIFDPLSPGWCTVALDHFNQQLAAYAVTVVAIVPAYAHGITRATQAVCGATLIFRAAAVPKALPRRLSAPTGRFAHESWQIDAQSRRVLVIPCPISYNSTGYAYGADFILTSGKPSPP